VAAVPLRRNRRRIDLLWARPRDPPREFQVVDWQPWVRASSTTTGQIGLFERWHKNALRYLVPETGEIFKVPRGSAAGGG
jgi:hypothetical protein